MSSLPSKAKASLKRIFSKEKLSAIVQGVRSIRQKVSRATAIWFLCLSSVVLLAAFIRILPIKWGYHLSEFDPYFHYRVTQHIVDNGFSSWSSWYDNKVWFPYGRDIARTSFPGLPFTSAVLYFAFRVIGLPVTVFDVCVMFPVIMAAVTCILAYFFGKDIGGKEVGLFCSLFLALNSAYILRTSLGFFDDETIGIFGILSLSIFYLRSLEPQKSWHISIGYAVAAGLSLGYVCASWGAARYPLSLLVLFSFILLLLKRYSSKLLISYGTVMGLGLLIAVQVPKLGSSFLREISVVAAAGFFLLLCVFEIAQCFKTRRAKVVFAACFIAASGLAVALLWYYGFISLPVAKFISVLNPFERLNMPLVESVQEHRPATWAAFYYEFGILIFLAPLGLMFALQKPTNNNVFLATYTITSAYFAASMIRLTIIMAPAFCALGALTIVEILKPFVDIATQKTFLRRRIRFAARVGREFSIGFMICFFLLLLPTLLRATESAYVPTTIASASIPARQSFNDWPEALAWMHSNLPEDAVVAAWWDYGYWITVVANKTTLADNGTLNSTQIAEIGRMFLSPEDQALEILKPYKVTHVLVFSTIGLGMAYGDEVKWHWMARIAGLNETELTDKELSSDTMFGFPFPERNLVLAKLILYGYGYLGTLGLTLDHFSLVFKSSNRLVFLYKVEYETS